MKLLDFLVASRPRRLLERRYFHFRAPSSLCTVTFRVQTPDGDLREGIGGHDHTATEKLLNLRLGLWILKLSKEGMPMT